MEHAKRLQPATQLAVMAAEVAGLRELVFQMQAGAQRISGPTTPRLHDALVAASNDLGVVEAMLVQRRRAVAR